MKTHPAATHHVRKTRQTLTDVRVARSLQELQDLVHEVLCARDRLDVAVTPIQSKVLMRAGKACGLLFEVKGPRLLASQAIWAADEHRILTYDSSGLRSGEIQLSESPDLDLEQLPGELPSPQVSVCKSP